MAAPPLLAARTVSRVLDSLHSLAPSKLEHSLGLTRRLAHPTAPLTATSSPSSPLFFCILEIPATVNWERPWRASGWTGRAQQTLPAPSRDTRNLPRADQAILASSSTAPRFPRCA